MLTQKLTVAAALLFGVAIVTGQDLNALPACAVSFTSENSGV